MELEQMIRDAALVGLACGVIVMAAALLYMVGTQLMKPTVTVTASTPRPPFGFSAP